MSCHEALDIIDQDQSGDLGKEEVETLLAAMGAQPLEGEHTHENSVSCRIELINKAIRQFKLSFLLAEGGRIGCLMYRLGLKGPDVTTVMKVVFDKALERRRSKDF